MLYSITSKGLVPVDETEWNASQERQRAQYAATREARAQEAQQLEADKARIIAELRAQYPWAEPPSDKLTDHARGAKNLKKHLAIAFPGVKFTVKSRSYSGGNSIDVAWAFGPTRKEVEAIANRYQEGSFDGMQDLYEFNQDAASRAWGVVMGGAKYVQCSRETGEFWTRIIDALGIKYGLDPADWTKQRQFERQASETLSLTHFPAGKDDTSPFHLTMPATGNDWLVIWD